ncbi:alpha/beta fold hydrolase [Roseisolibacter agri]|uniref:Alpha/beta hydrolase n=1 Tax=Roseisolibacter agri TaxID=2014610 RepID=A0AA37Q314_9BACT|nr:alpha/beta fold hydrolase [Roseisolibacter agri]GLC25669.1 alpha/beta hydrolase [Roseisolibacter agri]
MPVDIAWPSAPTSAPSPAPVAARPPRRPSAGPVLGLRLTRLGLAVASRVAPPLAEWQAARLFLTPRRRSLRDPVIPGIPADPRAFVAAGHPIVGWSWGEGPTVLLVHGWNGRAADMVALAEGLVHAGYRAVAIDLPAHGRSPGRRTSIAEWRRILPALAAQLGGIHAVVGHSLGGAAVTLALEAGLQAHAAVLLAPARAPRPYVARVGRFLGLPSARAAGMERRLESLVGGALAHFDAARAAATLTVPALVLHDPADDEVPWADGAAIADAWPLGAVEPVVGEGHFRILAAPEVVERVVEFIAAASV